MITNTRLDIIAKNIGLTVEQVHAFEVKCIAAGITTINWEFLEPMDVIGIPVVQPDGKVIYHPPIIGKA